MHTCMYVHVYFHLWEFENIVYQYKVSVLYSRNLQPTEPLSENVSSSSDCQKLQNVTSIPTNCEGEAWGVENRTCNPATYVGDVCKEPLLHWKNCIIGSNNSQSVIFSMTESQSHLEEQAMQIFEILSQFYCNIVHTFACAACKIKYCTVNRKSSLLKYSLGHGTP